MLAQPKSDRWKLERYNPLSLKYLYFFSTESIGILQFIHDQQRRVGKPCCNIAVYKALNSHSLSSGAKTCVSPL